MPQTPTLQRSTSEVRSSKFFGRSQQDWAPSACSEQLLYWFSFCSLTSVPWDHLQNQLSAPKFCPWSAWRGTHMRTGTWRLSVLWSPVITCSAELGSRAPHWFRALLRSFANNPLTFCRDKWLMWWICPYNSSLIQSVILDISTLEAWFIWGESLVIWKAIKLSWCDKEQMTSVSYYCPQIQ